MDANAIGKDSCVEDKDRERGGEGAAREELPHQAEPEGATAGEGAGAKVVESWTAAERPNEHTVFWADTWPPMPPAGPGQQWQYDSGRAKWYLLPPKLPKKT